MVDILDIRKIRQMTDEQILKAIDVEREQALQLRLDKATGELKDQNLIHRNKRNLARLLTVQNERKLAAEVAAGKESKNG
jgi:ribosomal protein L29